MSSVLNEQDERIIIHNESSRYLLSFSRSIRPMYLLGISYSILMNIWLEQLCAENQQFRRGWIIIENIDMQEQIQSKLDEKIINCVFIFNTSDRAKVFFNASFAFYCISLTVSVLVNSFVCSFIFFISKIR